MHEIPEAIGPFRILGVLGRGGMGVVYRGRHVQTGEPAAVKTVRAPGGRRLEGVRREIHALARVRHPGVVRILDEGIEGGLPWYAMELLEGATLQEHGAALWRGTRQAQAPSAGSPGAVATASREASAASAWWTEALGVPTRGTAGAPPAAGAGKASPEDSTIRISKADAAFEALVPAAQGHPGWGLQSPTPGRRQQAAGGALSEVLRLARALCSPLAYLHGEGIVHRDLKPENIFIRPDGRPVVMDFGLVSRFGGELSRERIDVAGWTVGTSAYMAPEQICGDLVDARADLYALGCILYELLTGRPPFVGETRDAVLAQHLVREPQRPSELVEGLPWPLEALVLRLLAKRRQDRLGHAADVASALARLGAEVDGVPAGPRPRAYLYRPGLAGRADALQQLEEHRGRLESGAGGLVLIGGESGVGKTRLVLEFARQDRLSGIHILVGECLPPGRQASGGHGGGALQALRRPLQAVADRCRERGVMETERLVGRRAAVLLEYEPALAGLPGQAEPPAPAELQPAAARLRLYHYLLETFTALAQDRPLLLALDDLHWADDLTIGFLAYLLHSGRLPRVPLLVVGTYRTEEVGEALEQLLSQTQPARLGLKRLDPAAVGSIVGDMLAIDPAPPELVRFLAGQSEGNPFFVAEYLRIAVDEGLLCRDAEGCWQFPEPEGSGTPVEAPGRLESLPLPGSILDLVGRRVEGLDPAAERLMQAAAVLGREPDGRLLARMLGLEEAGGRHARGLQESISELLRRQVLDEPEAGRLRFAHDKIREVADSAMTRERRSELHRAAAEAIEALWAERREELWAELGRHWAEAGERRRAQGCYLAAARQAAARYSEREAERCYLTYLELAEEPSAETVAAHNELGSQILRPRGRVDEARRQHEAALDEARGIGDRLSECHSLRALGLLLFNTGQMREARRLCGQALKLSRRLGARGEEAHCLRSLGSVDYLQDRLDLSRRRLAAALKLFRAVGHRQGEGQTLGLLAAIHNRQGRFEQTRKLYEQTLLLQREIGQRSDESVTLGNLGNLDYDLGRLERARELYEQSLALAREVGYRRQESIALDGLASVCQEQGRLAEARDLVRQALSIAEQSGLRREHGAMLTHLATLSAEQGLFEEARTLYEQALALAREIGSAADEAQALIGRAAVERRAHGDLDLARRLAADAERRLRGAGSGLELALCLCERGHVELAAGSSARPLLAEAEQIADALELRTGSGLEKALVELRRSQEAHDAGALSREAVL